MMKKPSCATSGNNVYVAGDGYSLICVFNLKSNLWEKVQTPNYKDISISDIFNVNSKLYIIGIWEERKSIFQLKDDLLEKILDLESIDHLFPFVLYKGMLSCK